jgi:hypothetical protein
MNGTRIVVLFLAGALLGGLLGVFVLGPSLRGDAGLDRAGHEDGASESRDPLDDPDRDRDDPTLRGAPVASERFQELEQENEELRSERETLSAKVEELESKIEASTITPRDPQAFRFGVPGKAPTFDEADWTALADHMTELKETLSELPEFIRSGQAPSQAFQTRIQKHNMPLAMFAVGFGSDTKDSTPNGAFTHPAVIANLMRASLAAADMPLTPDQEIALKTLGDSWLAETERMTAGLAQDAPVLEKTVLEVDAKLRFLDSARTVLTSEQRALLFPPETTGRLHLDLLSPVLVYVLVQPITAKDRADMETKLLESILERAGVEEPDLAAYAWVAREWVDDIPGVLEPMPSNSIDLRLPHVDKMQQKARAQVAAIERILAMGNLTPEQAESLRSMTTLLYPYVTP